MTEDDVFMLNQYNKFMKNEMEKGMEKKIESKTEKGNRNRAEIKNINRKEKKEESGVVKKQKEFFKNFDNKKKMNKRKEKDCFFQLINDSKENEKGNEGYSVWTSASEHPSSDDVDLMQHDQHTSSEKLNKRHTNKCFSNDTFSFMDKQSTNAEKEKAKKNSTSSERKEKGNKENEKKNRNKKIIEKTGVFQKERLSDDEFSFFESNEHSENYEEYNNSYYNISNDIDNANIEPTFIKLKKIKSTFSNNTDVSEGKKKQQKTKPKKKYSLCSNEDMLDKFQQEQFEDTKSNLFSEEEIKDSVEVDTVTKHVENSSSNNTKNIFLFDNKNFKKKFNYFINVSNNLKRNLELKSHEKLNETMRIHKNKSFFHAIEVIIKIFKKLQPPTFIQNMLYKELESKRCPSEIVEDHIKLLRNVYANDLTGVIFKNSYLEISVQNQFQKKCNIPDEKHLNEYIDTDYEKEEVICMTIYVKSLRYSSIYVKGYFDKQNSTQFIPEKLDLKYPIQKDPYIDSATSIFLKKDQKRILYRLFFDKKKIYYEHMFFHVECLINDNTIETYKIALPFPHFLLFNPNESSFNDFLASYNNYISDFNFFNNYNTNGTDNHIDEDTFYSECFISIVRDSAHIDQFIESMKMRLALNVFYFNSHNVLYTSLSSKEGKKSVLLIIYTYIQRNMHEKMVKFQFISQSSDLVYLSYNLFRQIL